ncbi:MAG TPA: hypothetical protein VH701_21115 [Vicinamibacterales bacterium]|jgi:hypothetical protein
MSLKSFHVVFITLSIVLASWFGIWAISNDGLPYVVTGAVSLLSAAGLIVYEVGFLKKCREIGLS